MVIFTISEKLFGSKKFLVIIGIFIIILIAAVMFAIFRDDPYTAEFDGKKYCLKAETKSDISKFADFFGLKIADEPVYTKNIVIPDNFNDIYLQYNDLQKQIGLDLEKYKAQNCTLNSYEIISPESQKECVLNLIIFDDRIIGGDISERIYGGKMYSLKG